MRLPDTFEPILIQTVSMRYKSLHLWPQESVFYNKDVKLKTLVISCSLLPLCLRYVENGARSLKYSSCLFLECSPCFWQAVRCSDEYSCLTTWSRVSFMYHRHYPTFTFSFLALILRFNGLIDWATLIFVFFTTGSTPVCHYLRANSIGMVSNRSCKTSTMFPRLL